MMKRQTLTLLICLLMTASLFAVAGFAGSQDPPEVSKAVDTNGAPLPGQMIVPVPERPDSGFSTTLTPPTVTAADPNVITLIGQLDEDLVLGYLEGLVAFGPRVTGSQAVDKAGDYIYEQFENMGLDVRFHNWYNWGYSGKNVEATLHGTGGSDEIYVVCAHYDCVSGSPGADDNGSGTVAVMALANLMSKCSFDKTIRFVTFDGEEQGLLGSHEYVKEASNNGDKIIAALNADMIGYALNQTHENNIKVYDDGSSSWITSYTSDISNEYKAQIGTLNIVPSGYSWGSDHYSFWEYSYHSVFYHEYKFNDYYHSSQDNIAHTNIPYLAKCSKLILATLAEMAGPCVFNPLYADSYTLNSRVPDTINFYLDADLENANRNYILLAGASGSEPGFGLPGGLATLPVNWDAVTDLVVGNINTPYFTDFLGVLDGSGQATAQLNTFGPIPGSVGGVELSFAFCCNNPFDYASNSLMVLVVD
jgi:hypothetical protein